ncbi:hypothetical protein D3C84_988920 [compost metagenome]
MTNAVEAVYRITNKRKYMSELSSDRDVSSCPFDPSLRRQQLTRQSAPCKEQHASYESHIHRKTEVVLEPEKPVLPERVGIAANNARLIEQLRRKLKVLGIIRRFRKPD